MLVLTLLGSGAALASRWRRRERLRRTLSEALSHQSAPAVRSLLREGADVNTIGPGGESVLEVAVTYADEALLDEALALGADAAARSADGRTTLLFGAVGKQNPALIARLLSAGAEVNARAATERLC